MDNPLVHITPSHMNIDFILEDPTNKSFAELMKVKRLDVPGENQGVHVLQSMSIPFQPVKGASAVFGGHVLGQSIYAAGKTVPDGFICHSSSSYFLAPGNATIPFIYRCEEIRNGSSYLTREVRVYQFDEFCEIEFTNEFLCYIAVLSFKRKQATELDYQAAPNSAFDARDDEIIQFELAPDVDNMEVMRLLEESGVEPQWHPIDCRKMDTREYNLARDLLNRRIVHYFRSTFQLGPDPHIHVALLNYISDRNSLFTLINIRDNPDIKFKHIASLNHVFTLHMPESYQTDGNYIQMETWSDRAFDSRGQYNGRMYTRDGRLLASFVQDGVVRVNL